MKAILDITPAIVSILGSTVVGLYLLGVRPEVGSWVMVVFGN